MKQIRQFGTLKEMRVDGLTSHAEAKKANSITGGNGEHSYRKYSGDTRFCQRSGKYVPVWR
jgi:hypothetical protein